MEFIVISSGRIGSTRYSGYPENYWPFAGGLSAAAATDSRLRDLIGNLLTADAVAVDYDGLRRGKREEREEHVITAHGIDDAELERVLPGYDALILRSANRVTRQMLETSPRVAVVGRAGSGVDNIDLDAARELGVPVVNAPTGNAGSVAELVMGVMLGVSRSIPRAHESMKRGEWAKKEFHGRSLKGKVLGIVGFGSVGQELARIAIALGMYVLVAAHRSKSFARSSFSDNLDPESDPSRSKRRLLEGEAGQTGSPPCIPLDDLLSKSDFLSLHVPLALETHGMIGARELALMKPSAVVVNAARGGVVDEQALLSALEEGRLGGAALDVFASEKAPVEDHVVRLCRLPNVICTPHIGGSTAEAGEQVLAEVCGAVLEALRGTVQLGRIVNGNPETSVRLARLPGGLL